MNSFLVNAMCDIVDWSLKYSQAKFSDEPTGTGVCKLSFSIDKGETGVRFG